MDLEEKEESVQEQENEEEFESPIFENTILDNLARLLEGGSSCSAICFINNKFIFTNNELSVGTGKKDGEGYKLITKLAEYLKLKVEEYSGPQKKRRKGRGKAKEDQNEEDKEEQDQEDQEEQNQEVADSEENSRIKIFERICLQKLSNRAFPGLVHKSRQEILDKIMQDLLENHKQWSSLNTKQVIEKFNLKGKDSNPHETATEILKTYAILSRAAHDFKRVEKAFKDKSLKDIKFKVVKDAASSSMHAELRVIDHLFKKENLVDKLKAKELIYIGISKICCADCRHMIKALNVVSATMSGEEKLDNHTKFDLKIISPGEKVSNKDRAKGTVIIRQNKFSQRFEVFDYHQNDFVDFFANQIMILLSSIIPPIEPEEPIFGEPLLKYQAGDMPSFEEIEEIVNNLPEFLKKESLLIDVLKIDGSSTDENKIMAFKNFIVETRALDNLISKLHSIEDVTNSELPNKEVDIRQYNALSEHLGCVKGIIGYCDASTRDTH